MRDGLEIGGKGLQMAAFPRLTLCRRVATNIAERSMGFFAIDCNIAAQQFVAAAQQNLFIGLLRAA